jgi:hypothetical protein
VRGQAEDALVELGRALQLESLNVHLLWNKAAFHYFARQYDEAMGLSMKGLVFVVQPRNHRGYGM